MKTKAFLMTMALMATLTVKAKECCPFNNWLVENWSTGTKPITIESLISDEDDGWILIGYVNLFSGGSGDLEAELYAREIANKIVYRIKYGGKYYATHVDSTDSHRYYVTIDKAQYIFSV